MKYYLVSAVLEVEADTEADALEQFRKWIPNADRDSFEVEDNSVSGFRLYQQNKGKEKQ